MPRPHSGMESLINAAPPLFEVMSAPDIYKMTFNDKKRHIYNKMTKTMCLCISIRYPEGNAPRSYEYVNSLIVGIKFSSFRSSDIGWTMTGHLSVVTMYEQLEMFACLQTKCLYLQSGPQKTVPLYYSV